MKGRGESGKAEKRNASRRWELGDGSWEAAEDVEGRRKSAEGAHKGRRIKDEWSEWDERHAR
jgi:hypothetical protein